MKKEMNYLQVLTLMLRALRIDKVRGWRTIELAIDDLISIIEGLSAYISDLENENRQLRKEYK